VGFDARDAKTSHGEREVQNGVKAAVSGFPFTVSCIFGGKTEVKENIFYSLKWGIQL
jgi:hypothetical protein